MVLMSKDDNKRLNIIIRPILVEEIVQTNQKTVFFLLLAILGPFGHPQMDPKR
jgi:hypothetical protein